MNAIVEVISPGLYSTIQDLGRTGYGKYGVPKSGPMDLRSFLLANSILNNNENCAVIEWTIIPPVLRFHGDTIIAVTGAICTPFLNDIPCKMNHQINIKKGDVLTLKNVIGGVIGFVGIYKGFSTGVVLNSRSYYNNITEFVKLSKSDKLPFEKSIKYTPQYAALSAPIFWNETDIIYAYKGPEYCQLNEGQNQQLLNSEFIISKDRNRMAIPLDNDLKNDLPSMFSTPVLPGTVQLTPSGKLIVLMRDCQTTGGYPRILQLTTDSIDIIAQKRIGETIRLQLKSFET